MNEFIPSPWVIICGGLTGYFGSHVSLFLYIIITQYL